jgi:hypothetical protein
LSPQLEVSPYVETARANDGDAYFGQALPMFLKDGGLTDVRVRISQPAALNGEVKVINALAMEGFGPRAIAAGLTTEAEVQRIADPLYDAAADPTLFMSIARIVQAWGRKPVLIPPFHYLAPPPGTGVTDPRMANFLAAIDAGAHSRRILYIGSSGVYPDRGGAWVDRVGGMHLENP